jgi:hypothetical protein
MVERARRRGGAAYHRLKVDRDDRRTAAFRAILAAKVT